MSSANPHVIESTDRAVYRRLVAGFQAAAGRSAEERWRWLMAAHVAGQMDFRCHLHSHVLMLGLAVKTRDWSEAAGQVFRLVLVPAGHVLGRQPAGNVGRATVSAFQPMPLEPHTRQLLAQARESVRSAAMAPATRSSAGRQRGR